MIKKTFHQINGRYWCGSSGKNVCKIDCKKLLDDNIKDDADCAKKIFKIHGFNAWVVWKRDCINTDNSKYLKGCSIIKNN